MHIMQRRHLVSVHGCIDRWPVRPIGTPGWDVEKDHYVMGPEGHHEVFYQRKTPCNGWPPVFSTSLEGCIWRRTVTPWGSWVIDPVIP
jgi:hypothetical protein